jgi:hypothetical protein
VRYALSRMSPKCARLMTLSMPQVMDRPMAISA